MITLADTLEERRLVDAYLYGDGARIELGAALEQALEQASQARALIAPAQEQLRASEFLDGTHIEREARAFQLELIARQLNSFACIAEERLRHFETILTEADVAAEHARCQAGLEGTLHWFRYYAWGYDPRPLHALSLQPFSPFPFQERYVGWMEHTIFTRRRSGTVEKAREMGASFAAYLWTLKQWRYREHSSFLWISQNEDLVDSKKDSNTIFERMRQMLRLMPTWWLPKGYSEREHAPYMMIANPENSSVITGKAPTKTAGRQSRVTAVFKDESAFWPYGGYPQHTALSQTSPCLIDISSVAGQFNQFAELARSEHANNFTMDWRDHPWKDKRWYDSLPYGYIAPQMSEEGIAQEIDRNYAASQPGKVFRNISEPHLFITWSEMVEFYAQHDLALEFFDHFGRYTVPQDWSWARSWDYGQTEAHPWIAVWVARPPESWPLTDTLFVFAAERILPVAADVADAQKIITEVEQDLGWRKFDGEFNRRPKYSRCSHERDSERATFLKEYKEKWEAWSTDYTEGIPQLQAWFGRIEPLKPNPFRPQLQGRTRIVFVAPDGEYTVKQDQSLQWFLTPSKTDKGFKLLRSELEAYHYPKEEAGKAVKDMRPEKIKDDTIDNLRAHAIHWGPKAKPSTEEQKRNAALPEHLQAATVAKVQDSEERHNRLLTRDVLLSRMKRKSNKTAHWNAEE